MSFTAELIDAGGLVHSESSGSLEFGGDLKTLSVETSPSGVDVAPHARVEGTYDTAAIKRYTTELVPRTPQEIRFVNDTRWIAKIGTDAKLQTWYDHGGAGGTRIFCCDVTHIGPMSFAVERATEKYAVWAIAPNSASGFVPHLNEPGNEIRYNVQFYSEFALPQDFQNNLFAPFGSGPMLDFRGEFFDTLAAINVGHIMVVDLDVFGIAPGESYGFSEDLWFEAYVPSIGDINSPGAIASEAFLNIDPVIGIAFAVPEPATLGLAAGGLLLLRRGAGRGKASALQS